MVNSSDARVQLGLLLKGSRAEKGWDRGELARRTKLKVRVIINLEHGVVNPRRHDFLRVIRELELSAQAEEEAGRLLGIIHPPKRKKFHLHSSILKQRSRRRDYRSYR